MLAIMLGLTFKQHKVLLSQFVFCHHCNCFYFFFILFNFFLKVGVSYLRGNIILVVGSQGLQDLAFVVLNILCSRI